MARRQKVDEEEHNYWMSYSDMMAALFLVFILIITFTLVQSKLQADKDKQEVERKNKDLQEAKDKSDEKEEQLKKIIGVKAEIIKELQERFEKKNIEIKVDDKTGAIELKSNILFDVNRSELKPEGKKFIKSFLPEYVDGLLEHEDKITEIIIEGHTDDDAPKHLSKDDAYLYNLKLSQNRAFSVVQYCIDPKSKIFKDKKKRDKLQEILTSNGKSYSELKYKKDSQGNVILDKKGKKIVDKTGSRRVEIQFRIGDDEMIAEMKKVIEENKQ